MLIKKLNVANTWQSVKSVRNTWEERFSFFFILNLLYAVMNEKADNRSYLPISLNEIGG